MPDDPFEPVAAEPSAGTGPRPFDDPAAVRPTGLLFVAMLWLSPGRFFDSIGRARRPLLTTVAIIIAGMATTADRIDSQRVTAELANASTAHLPQTWPAHWTLVLIAGLFVGLLTYGIGGWWHRLRLRWCGVRDPDPVLSRQVYMVSKIVAALPMLALLGYHSVAYATPDGAYQNSWVVLDLAVLVTLYWASYSNYSGLRVVFDARRIRAIVWFLALPWGLYTLAVGFYAAVFILAAKTAPETLTPRPFRSETWTFQHPIQWRVATDDTRYNPDSFLRIVANPDGWVEFERYGSTNTPSEEVAVTLDAYGAEFGPMRDDGEFTEWAGVAGAGAIATGQWEGAPLQFRVFATTLADGTMFEVREAWFPRDDDWVRPGFEMVRNSFSLHMPVAPAGPPADAPDTLTPHTFHSAVWSFDYPGEWKLRSSDPAYDPEASVHISAVPDGWFELLRYDTTMPPSEEIVVTMDAYAVDFGPVTRTGEHSQWAGLQGVGAEYAGQWQSRPLKFMIFIIDLSDGTTLEVREARLERDREVVRPGFEMIRSSFFLAISTGLPTEEPAPAAVDPPY